jgi:hypothetical protein
VRPRLVNPDSATGTGNESPVMKITNVRGFLAPLTLIDDRFFEPQVHSVTCECVDDYLMA